LEKGPRGLRRGRGARERILSASQQLFRDQGINCTGMDQLCAVAEVSKRTLYQHFTGKDELIAECLRRFDPDILPEVFDRTDLTPRERLLAAFDVHAPLCPFIAAAVEIPDPGHPARVHARNYKKGFAARLTDTAREAGATNPEQLGEQLALLLDGASARSRVLNTEAFTTAAAIAAVLVDNAIPTAAAPAGASAVEQHGQDDDDDDAGRGGARPKQDGLAPLSTKWSRPVLTIAVPWRSEWWPRSAVSFSLRKGPCRGGVSAPGGVA
jgi:AcrR family transcriptional regulator